MGHMGVWGFSLFPALCFLFPVPCLGGVVGVDADVFNGEIAG
jgi:hypothetical protein